MTAVGALADLLPNVTVVVGKGGVGKTTCAAAFARAFAARNERTLIVSTDPAAALANVLGAPVSGAAQPVAGVGNLDARQLSAEQLRTDFFAQWRDVIAEIMDRGTYLDRADIDGLVDAAFPGADEIFAVLALADLVAARDESYDRLVVDTAPTGHTLRLLALPETFRALLTMFDLMQEKHRFMVRTLTRRYRRDRADEFLTDLRTRIDALRSALADERRVAAVLVTRAEPVVEQESRKYIAQLRALHVRVAGVVVNAAHANVDAYRIDDTIPHFVIPFAERPAAAGSVDWRAIKDLATLSRTLTVVGGKGGVGKSTVACALALAAAEVETRDVLLVSTDPAPSLADAFGESNAPWARADVEHRLDGVDHLVIRQMDASAAFARIRDEYQSRIDALFEALVGRGVDVAQDRAILRDLLSLAPPGIDELFALSLLGDSLAEQHFARIIVDPAPTGHLLRLLDMPEIALEWTHRLMRLMLKYREVVGLGETAEDLIAFAKRTRALQAMLHDSARSGLIIVSLDEPVVRAETDRLATAVRQRSIDLIGVVWNRTRTPPMPLPATLAARQFCAMDASPSPVGVAALREWSRSWREIESSTN